MKGRAGGLVLPGAATSGPASARRPVPVRLRIRRFTQRLRCVGRRKTRAGGLADGALCRSSLAALRASRPCRLDLLRQCAVIGRRVGFLIQPLLQLGHDLARSFGVFFRHGKLDRHRFLGACLAPHPIKRRAAGQRGRYADLRQSVPVAVGCIEVVQAANDFQSAFHHPYSRFATRKNSPPHQYNPLAPRLILPAHTNHTDCSTHQTPADRYAPQHLSARPCPGYNSGRAPPNQHNSV